MNLPRTVTPSAWPRDYQIALFPYQGAVQEIAEALTGIGGFDPILMRVELEAGDDPSPPGDYLLLPSGPQADHWDAALLLCQGRPAAAVSYLVKNPDAALTATRLAVSIELLRTDRRWGESAAFDVLVNGVYMGHWVESKERGASVSWIPDGQSIETERCGGDSTRVVAAIRQYLPKLGERQPRSPGMRRGRPAAQER